MFKNLKGLFIELFLIITLSTGCEKLLIKPAETSNKEIFIALWDYFDRHYPSFEIKHLNWDSVYHIYDRKINNSLNDQAFFDTLSGMLGILKDGHVWLSNGRILFSSGSKNKYIHYFDNNIVNNYIKNIKKNNIFTYGKLDDQTGYIRISTFKNEYSGYEFISNILDQFYDCNRIVIDIRENSGGNENNAKIIAEKFCNQKIAYSYDVFRNSAAHNDFSKPYYKYIEPSKNTFPKFKLALITDRSVGSSGEDFTMMMGILPQVTVIGDTTMGNPGGTPNARELANGWIFYMPTSLQYTINHELVYKGLAPDITVAEKVNGKDIMIEKAIEVLN